MTALPPMLVRYCQVLLPNPRYPSTGRCNGAATRRLADGTFVCTIHGKRIDAGHEFQYVPDDGSEGHRVYDSAS